MMLPSNIHSKREVSVHCDAELDENCMGDFKISFSDIIRSGPEKSIFCFFCQERYERIINETKRLDFVDTDLCSLINPSLFSVVDTEEKAFALGWIAACIVQSVDSYSRCEYVFRFDKDDEIPVWSFENLYILLKLRNIFNSDLPIFNSRADIRGSIVVNEVSDGHHSIDCNGFHWFTVHSKIIASDIRRWLGIHDGWKNFRELSVPKLENEEFQWAFIRAFFEMNSPKLLLRASLPYCCFHCFSPRFLESISGIAGIPNQFVGLHGKRVLLYSGVNALDLMRKIYDRQKRLSGLLESYYEHWAVEISLLHNTQDQDFLRPSPLRDVFHGGSMIPHCLFSKTHPDAVTPGKIRGSDVGYDLTIIRVADYSFGSSILYDTCIRIQPPWGWYGEVVSRSSISKTGYMLANGVGIIDRAYTGSIKIALIKIDPMAQEIQLPFRGFQLIFRPVAHFHMEEIDEQSLHITERADQGFGSSNKKKKSDVI